MTTWNASDKSATITLSGGNLTATSSTGTSQSVRSTTSKSSGKVYFEVTLSTLTNDIAVGVANATMALGVGGGLGADANGLGFYAVSPAQAIYIAGSSLSGGSTASSAGAVICVAFDIGNKLIWIGDAVMRAASQNWNNSATANPATGTGGISTSTLAAGPYFVCFNDDVGGAVCTANFGGSAFNQAIPSGFSSWDVQGSTVSIPGTASTALVGQSQAKAALAIAGSATTSLVGSSSSNQATFSITGSASTSLAGSASGGAQGTVAIGGVANTGFVGSSSGTATVGVGGTLTNTYGAQTIFYAAEVTIARGGTATLTISQGHGTTPHGPLAQFPDSLAATTQTIYASDLGYRTSAATDGNPVVYPALITQAFAINRAVNLEPSNSAIAAAWGTLNLTNAGGQFNSIVSSWNNTGRPINLYYGFKSLEIARKILLDPAYSSLTPVIKGMQGTWFLSETDLQIPIRDATYWIQQPLQTAVYAGTGSYNGTASLTGAPLPKARGGSYSNPIRNITPLLIDPTNLIYQYTDGAGTVAKLYEGGYATFTYQADTTNLYAGTTTAGSYRTDNSRGLFQLGSTPVNAITADVTGAFPVTGSGINLIQIVEQFLIQELSVPSSNISVSNFNSVAGAFPYEAGIYFATNDSPDGLTAISRLLSSIGAKLYPGRDGGLRIMVLRDPNKVSGVSNGLPAATFNTTNAVSIVPQALPSTIDPPTYRVRVGYNHNYTVQTTGFDGGATTAQRQFAATSDSFQTALNSSVQSTYARPNDLAAITGALTHAADALTVANDLIALWGVRRRLYSVTVPIAVGLARDIGDLVLLVWPMDDLGGGKLGVIVGEQFTSTGSTITFQVLC